MKKVLLLIATMLVFGCHAMPEPKSKPTEVCLKTGDYYEFIYAYSPNIEKSCNIEEQFAAQRKLIVLGRRCGSMEFSKEIYADKTIFKVEHVRKDFTASYGNIYVKKSDCYIQFKGIFIPTNASNQEVGKFMRYASKFFIGR